jgi:hypothetical protein
VVVLGRANSRMKDFSRHLSSEALFEFKGDVLARAIAAIFTRRKAKFRPSALTR